MRAAVVTIPSAMNPSPTMIISTLIFSRAGICFGGFMVLRLLAGTMVDRRSVGRRKAGHTARRCDCNARFCCVPRPPCRADRSAGSFRARIGFLGPGQAAPKPSIPSSSSRHWVAASGGSSIPSAAACQGLRCGPDGFLRHVSSNKKAGISAGPVCWRVRIARGQYLAAIGAP